MGISEYPAGWKLEVTLLEGLAYPVAWKLGIPMDVLYMMGGIWGVGVISKAVTDTAKIKQNGNGKASVPCDTTGAPDNRGAS